MPNRSQELPAAAPANPQPPEQQTPQHISMQQAIAAALVTALLGGGLGAGGGLTFGASDVVHMADLKRVEAMVDRLDTKVEALDTRMVDLRIALAQRGVAVPSSP